MKKRPLKKRAVLILLIAVSIALNLFVLQERHRHTSVSAAQQRKAGKRVVNSAFPKAYAKLEQEVAALKQESLEASLDNLSIPDMYFWPWQLGHDGAEPIELPFPAEHGQGVVGQLMSNRRVLKVYQHLAALPKQKAGELIAKQIENSLVQYESLFNECISENGDRFPPGVRNAPALSFVVGNTDKPTLVGVRLQVLALVFLAGNLELSDAAASVRTVAKRAVEQYEQFQSPEKNNLYFRFTVLDHAGLYNRQALAVGLIGTMPNHDDPAVEKFRKLFRAKKLTHFDARITEYDHAAIWDLDVDYPEKPLNMAYLNELSDVDFREVIAASSLAP